MSYINILAQAATPAEAAAPVAAPAEGTTVQPAATPAAGTPAAAPEANWGTLLFYIVIFGVLIYFMAIRPQRKQQKEMQERQDSLKVGDKIVTIGGLYGIIREVQAQSIKLEIAPNTIVKFAKSAVAQNVSKDGTPEDSKK